MSSASNEKIISFHSNIKKIIEKLQYIILKENFNAKYSDELKAKEAYCMKFEKCVS